MKYKGKLYGKMGNTYFPLLHTTDDWEQLENKVKELESVVNHIASVSKRLWTFDCWDRHGKMQKVLIEAYDAEHATLLFKANEDYQHLGFDPPY